MSDGVQPSDARKVLFFRGWVSTFTNLHEFTLFDVQAVIFPIQLIIMVRRLLRVTPPRPWHLCRPEVPLPPPSFHRPPYPPQRYHPASCLPAPWPMEAPETRPRPSPTTLSPVSRPCSRLRRHKRQPDTFSAEVSMREDGSDMEKEKRNHEPC